MLLISIIVSIVTNQVSAQLISTPPVVPSSHPRLFITKDRLPALREKVATYEFSPMVKRVYSNNTPVCKAFEYLMLQNAAVGRDAINSAYNWLLNTKAYKDNRDPYKSVFHASVVFDWCYDLFGQSGIPSKATYIKELRRVISMDLNGGFTYYPYPLKEKSIVGHFVEGPFYNHVWAGIALHGDDNTVYGNMINFLLNRIQEENNFWARSHLYHQGQYIGTRHSHSVLAMLALNGISNGKHLFSDDMQYVPYQLIYYMRPDRQLIRAGDVRVDGGKYVFHDMVARYTANYYNDPYLRWIANQNIFSMYDSVLEKDLFDIIYKPSNAIEKPINELPLTKLFDEPVGTEMIARTGWNLDGVNSKDALVQMRIGNYYFGNHQHKDFGTFQIYYKGNLTGDSGMYGGTKSQSSDAHWRNYYKSTIAHNGLLIIDPKEKYSGGSWTNTAVDGGMRWPYNDDIQPDNLNELLNPSNGYVYANVIGHDFGPNKIKPEFSFLSGDLTPGYIYTNGANKNKVEKVTRSMVTLNTNDSKYPAAFVVYDRIEATNEDFRKVFLMHTIKEPLINGNKIVIKRSDGLDGKLVSYTLLPEKPKFKKVFGYVINGQDFDPGTKNSTTYEDLAWRTEVSPSDKNLKHQFLHVMAVMDQDESEPTAERIINDNLVGAKILDRVILFDKNGTAITDASFNLELDKLYKVLLCDILPGEWIVENNGHIIGYFTATEEGKNIYFETKGGKINLRHVSSFEIAEK